MALLEGGPTKYLKAYENATYEIPIAGDPDVKVLYFDGLPFSNTVEYTVYEVQDIRGQFYYIGMGIVSQEGTSQGILFKDQDFIVTGTPYPNDEWFSNDLEKV